jgi:mono/diheme cytochrome c family protein
MRVHQTLQKLIYILIPLCMLLAACATEDAEEKAAATEETFNESCGVCHSLEDNGPSVADLRALSPEELRAGIVNHPTAGQILDRLTAAQIDDLIKFLEE